MDSIGTRQLEVKKQKYQKITKRLNTVECGCLNPKPRKT